MATISSQAAPGALAVPPAPPRALRGRLAARQLLWLNLFWFANALHWGALLAVVLPSQVDKLFGNKEANYPFVVAGGTLAALVVHPLAGALSDRTTARLGRRRPWLLWATLPHLVGLAALALAPSVGAMALAYVMVQAANNAASGPWGAIIADRVRREQRGAASGLYGLLTAGGTIAGALLAGLLVDKTSPLELYRGQLLTVYASIAAVQLAAVLATLRLVPEEPLHPTRRRPFTWRELARTYWVRPGGPSGHGRDFFWVCVTRLLVQMGIAGVFYYLQYYFEDVLGLPGERTVGAQFLPLVMLSATLTVYFAGSLSDRVGRKPLVYLSGALMSLVCLGFIVWQRPLAVPIAALCFGVGYGAYTSVDWALACDVLPRDEDAGRDMGIWAMMGILPQVIGILFGGALLSFFKGFAHHLGYTLLFCLTLVYFVLGTALVCRVRGTR